MSPGSHLRDRVILRMVWGWDVPGELWPVVWFYHVVNRANRRVRIFHKAGGYLAFLKVLGEGLERVPCRLLGICLMPNHWHLVLWPLGVGICEVDEWVTNTHVKRY